jgi:hypothetical protein
MLQGRNLGDHPAHRHTDEVGGVDAEGVEHADGIGGHVPDPVRRTGPVDVGGQPDVPVVELHDPVPGSDEALDQLTWPPQHRRPASHHQEHRHPVRSAQLLVPQRHSVGVHISRSHHAIPSVGPL